MNVVLQLNAWRSQMYAQNKVLSRNRQLIDLSISTFMRASCLVLAHVYIFGDEMPTDLAFSAIMSAVLAFGVEGLIDFALDDVQPVRILGVNPVLVAIVALLYALYELGGWENVYFRFLILKEISQSALAGKIDNAMWVLCLLAALVFLYKHELEMCDVDMDVKVIPEECLVDMDPGSFSGIGGTCGNTIQDKFANGDSFYTGGIFVAAFVLHSVFHSVLELNKLWFYGIAVDLVWMLSQFALYQERYLNVVGYISYNLVKLVLVTLFL